MRLHLALGLVATFAVAAAFQPAQAQTHGSNIGFNAGVVLYSSMNSGGGQTPELELKPDPSAVGGLQYDFWVGAGNLGFRFAGWYQRMQLDWSNGQRTIYAWSADFDALLRPVRPRAGTRVIPYLSLGIGATRYLLGDGRPTAYDPAQAVYPGDESTKFSVLGGIGFDIVLAGLTWDEGPFVLRLEAQDNFMLDSPFVPATGTGEFDGVHNLRVTLGFHNTMGRLF